jgi:hypothetical protein
MNEITGEASQLTLDQPDHNSLSGPPAGHRRSPSIRSDMSYSSLPYGARVHRASWSTQEFSDHFVPTRPRTLSNPLYSREGGVRFTSGGVPPLMTRVTSAEHDLRKPSPLSADVGRSVTPVGSPAPGEAADGSIPRPKSTPRGSLSSGARPQLQTVMSESRIPTLPPTTHATEVMKASQ